MTNSKLNGSTSLRNAAKSEHVIFEMSLTAMQVVATPTIIIDIATNISMTNSIECEEIKFSLICIYLHSVLFDTIKYVMGLETDQPSQPRGSFFLFVTSLSSLSFVFICDVTRVSEFRSQLERKLTYRGCQSN